MREKMVNWSLLLVDYFRSGVDMTVFERCLRGLKTKKPSDSLVGQS